jgi:hypothetical protein
MTDTRCYTIGELLQKLQMTPTTFKRLRKAGRLPFLEELRPRLGRRVRYRAAPVDRYFEGQWGQPRAFSSHRRIG